MENDPSALRDGIPSAWTEEPDGSAVGYMCLTDWEFEIGNASGGNRVYPSIEDIKRSRKCVAGCGIMEVRVTGIRVVEPAHEEEGEEGWAAWLARSAETTGSVPEGDGGPVAKPCAQLPAELDPADGA